MIDDLKTNGQVPVYTLDDLRSAIELILIYDHPGSHPAQRRAAYIWYMRVFPMFDVKFRLLARRTARAIAFQREGVS